MRMPKVGDEVVVEWLDSGRDVRMPVKEAMEATLGTGTAYGQVLLVDKDRLIVAMDRAGEDTDSSTCAVIWPPSIRRWDRLR